MKILKIALVFAFFSSVAYAGNSSVMTEKTAYMTGFRAALANKCLDGYSDRAAQRNHILSDKETKSVLETCVCVTDKAIEKAGGESLILSKKMDVIKEKLGSVMADKDQMMPIIKECSSKKPDFIK